MPCCVYSSHHPSTVNVWWNCGGRGVRAELPKGFLFQSKLLNLPPKQHVQRPGKSKETDLLGGRWDDRETVKAFSGLAFLGQKSPPHLISSSRRPWGKSKGSIWVWRRKSWVLLPHPPSQLPYHYRKGECLLHEAEHHCGAELLPGSLLPCPSSQDGAGIQQLRSEPLRTACMNAIDWQRLFRNSRSKFQSSQLENIESEISLLKSSYVANAYEITLYVINMLQE